MESCLCTYHNFCACEVIFFHHVDQLIFVSQATLMTVALKDDLSKKNRTIYDVRQSFHDKMKKATIIELTNESQTLNPVSSEKEFLKELESMLCTELNASDTEEALDFAKEIYEKTNSNKDVSEFYSPYFWIDIKVKNYLNRPIMPCWFSTILWDYRKKPFAISCPETPPTAMNLNRRSDGAVKMKTKPISKQKASSQIENIQITKKNWQIFLKMEIPMLEK